MSNQDENFDSLRRALRLKRHEQPPPGFYNNFSRQVISRLQENAGHDRAGVMDAASWEAPWINRLLSFFQAKPGYVGIIGATACVVLLGGIMLTERPTAVPVAGAVAEAPHLGTPQNFAGIGLLNNGAETPAMNVNPAALGALPPGSTLFDQFKPLSTTPVFAPTNLIK